jgi:hypothetical protein
MEPEADATARVRQRRIGRRHLLPRRGLHGIATRLHGPESTPHHHLIATTTYGAYPSPPPPPSPCTPAWRHPHSSRTESRQEEAIALALRTAHTELTRWDPTGP